MINSVRDYQIRCNSLRLPESTVLEVDGMNGPNTRKQIALVMKAKRVSNQEDIMDPSGIYRIHWHWTASTYAVNWDVVKHYNYVFDKDGNKYDGGTPPQQQAVYIPNKFGVSHTLNANTHAVGLSVAAMGGAEANWSTGAVNQGKYPLTWEGIDAMLKETAILCKIFDIRPSQWTTLSHAEVQGTLGIKQNGKWDFQVLPDNPTKLMTAQATGDILRKRMQEKFL